MAGRRRKSKKRSDASSRSTKLPDERFEFFIDECVAYHHVAATLREAGFVAHVPGPETFSTGTQDVDWLPRVGERGWILITKDKNIRKRGLELRALNQARVRTFVVTAAGLKGEEQAQLLNDALPAMLRLLRRRSVNFIARITAESSVEIIEFNKYSR
jgi:hypothetical protein